MDRKTQLYTEMIRRPEGADATTWSEIGRRCGYTGRADLAGYFGGRVPSMVRLAEGRRVLTDAGRARAGRRGA